MLLVDMTLSRPQPHANMSDWRLGACLFPDKLWLRPRGRFYKRHSSQGISPDDFASICGTRSVHFVGINQVGGRNVASHSKCCVATDNHTHSNSRRVCHPLSKCSSKPLHQD